MKKKMLCSQLLFFLKLSQPRIFAQACSCNSNVIRRHSIVDIRRSFQSRSLLVYATYAWNYMWMTHCSFSKHLQLVKVIIGSGLTARAPDMLAKWFGIDFSFFYFPILPTFTKEKMAKTFDDVNLLRELFNSAPITSRKVLQYWSLVLVRLDISGRTFLSKCRVTGKIVGLGQLPSRQTQRTRQVIKGLRWS